MKILFVFHAATVGGQAESQAGCGEIGARSESRRGQPNQLSDLLKRIAKAKRLEALRFAFSVIGALTLLFVFLLVLHLSL